VTIRKTLLYAFLAVGLLPAMLLAGLAFYRAHQALRKEIDRDLIAQTVGVSAAIDRMMFERLQNAQTWSHLDIMQDIQIRDIDQRLSRFLADLHRGYSDIYVDLSCTDSHGTIISSSNALLVGKSMSHRPWESVNQAGSRIILDLPESAASAAVLMHVAIPSAYANGAIGELLLRMDWHEVEKLLDRVAGDIAMLAIVDRQGRLIAASSRLRTRDLPIGATLKGWAGDIPHGRTLTLDSSPLWHESVIVGAAESHGYAEYKGLGWTALMIVPADSALAPIRHMAMIFLMLLSLIALVTALVAIWISKAIARPIVALTELTRTYLQNGILQAPTVAGTGEVGELSRTFVQMVRNIDMSQRNLVRASKLAIVGEMSSVIAHEVRTPLGILRSSAQMLQREASISAESKELVGFIESETERLNRLVSAMLDMARPRSPIYVPTDIHALLNRTVAMLTAQATQKQVTIALHLQAAPATIECDSEQMTQVFLNLLMNGLQILAHGGRIDIATGNDANGVWIEIADDGPGIAPEERSRIFEAFFFRREGGVGLGLAIVQQIVTAHGGQIEAMESRSGGALFRVNMPYERVGK
jgi:signal transduction histidine kinase